MNLKEKMLLIQSHGYYTTRCNLHLYVWRVLERNDGGIAVRIEGPIARLMI